ncbi:hypothetical protein BGZ90_008943 [Linnemannia elongata]|nr:hypothetical protein BGZ90_008943 [Linnemannia elongata]
MANTRTLLALVAFVAMVFVANVEAAPVEAPIVALNIECTKTCITTLQECLAAVVGADYECRKTVRNCIKACHDAGSTTP